MDSARIDGGEGFLPAHHCQATMPGTMQQQGNAGLLFLPFMAPQHLLCQLQDAGGGGAEVEVDRIDNALLHLR
jgi:hypothetical protein